MEREQVQTLHETAKQVRHALAGIISSLEMVIDEFDILSPDLKALFEDSWHKTYLQAIENLNQACHCFKKISQEAAPSFISAPPANENG
jgi:hypothetical protein